MVFTRRIYDPEKPGEQYKVFVDRLWPRGIAKDKAGWDEWMKELAPSDELRKWYGHEPGKWEEFKLRYKIELESQQDGLRKLKQLESDYGTLTLLYSSRETEYNNANALKEFLMRL